MLVISGVIGSAVFRRNSIGRNLKRQLDGILFGGMLSTPNQESRMHPIRLAFSLTALALLSALPAAAQEMMVAPPPPMRAGTRAPAFSSRTLAGKPISLHSLRGKVVLLDFWATWCVPCRMSMPTLRALHRTFHRRGFTVVGISMDAPDTLSQVRPFIKARSISYPIALAVGPNAHAQQAYHAEILPSQYLIDRKGIVRWSQVGYSPGDHAELTQRIQKLLAKR
jgi:peroxiredoxin